jgi:hypothetical protein
VSCGSSPDVAQSFGSALWVLDTLFEMASVEVDGVNIHTYPNATYNLFAVNESNGRWAASVGPDYYAMLMFAQAAPPGSTLLPLSLAGGSALRSWATVGRRGVIRVALINESSRRLQVAVKTPAAAGAATLERLVAPSILAHRGVTLGGRSFGSQTQTGVLTGPSAIASVSAAAGTYRVTLPAASAAMLAFPRRSRLPTSG